MKPKSRATGSFDDKKARDQGQDDSDSDTFDSCDKKARDQGQNNDSQSVTTNQLKQEAMSSRRLWLFVEGVVNMLSPCLLALALRKVDLKGEGILFMFVQRTISPIAAVMDYMIIVLPLLDFMMHILSQVKMLDESQQKMDEEKRTKNSRVDGGMQLTTMMSQQTMDQEEPIENSSTVDKQQLIVTSMTTRQKMDQEEQIESSRVDEQHLTNMTSQQKMNQEDQADSSRQDDQKIDKGEISRVDEQQLTSMTSNQIEMREQEVKLFGVHKLGLPMTILHLQVVPGLLKTSQYETLVRASMVVVSMLALCSQMLSPVWSYSGFAGTENYIISASVVITAYGMLLLIDMSYAKIIIVPIAILIFIVALWNKLRLKSGLKVGSGYCVKDVSKSVEELLVLTAVPYCALYFEAFFPNSLALSQFLWFLSSSLGAVAVMIALLPVAVNPGGAQVLQLLHRTCITVLTITVHTKAAEWAREDTALVFTPELVTVLVWFTIPFRLGVSDLSSYSGVLRKSIVVVIFVVLGYTTSPACQYKGRTRALRACSYSGCLTYFSMCMLRQWPGSKPVSQVPVKLLEFFAKNCFIAAAVLAVMSATHGDFINYMLVDTGRAILSSVYLFLFLLLGPAENKRRFLRFLDPTVAAGRRFIHLSRQRRLHSSLFYLNLMLKQCAQWFGETSPHRSSGKLKTQ